MLYKIGGSFLTLAICTFLYGVSSFVSRGNMSQFTRDLAEYSFVLWFPLLVLGILLIVISKIIR
ncbi:hypothetical protein SOM16_02130 [Pedobacter sp. CFBP9032]|nr:hypothetical protein [Pedobacter sp. CFBP9032]